MPIDKADLEKAIRLSFLEVNESKKDQYLEQLNNVLGYMDQLNQIDLTDVAPTAHSNENTTLLRDDIVVKQDSLLLEKNAPVWENGAFSVPKILG